MKRAPLVPITLTFLLGILLGMAPAMPFLTLVVWGLISVALAWVCFSDKRSGLLALLILWLCVGMLRAYVWRMHPAAALESIIPVEPQPVRLHGILLDDPIEPFAPREPMGDEADRQPHQREPGLTVVLDVDHARMDGTWRLLLGRICVHIQGDAPEVRYGDELLVEGQWLRIPAAGNPGQYDWRSALHRKRVYGLLQVAPHDGIVILNRGLGKPAWDAIFRLGHRWEHLIEEAFPPQQAGLLLSLLLGRRVALDERLKRAFVETGTIHLLVISGSHVGLIAIALELFLRLAGLSFRLRPWVVALGLGGYCVLTGMQPPVVRATLMAWVVLLAYVLGRSFSWPNTLALSAAIILWVNPTQIFDASFQLSFGAVLSLMLLCKRWSEGLKRRLQWLAPAWLRGYIALSLGATAAIWVGLWPILAWYFYLLSPISILANLIVAPLMSALVVIGTVMLAIGTIGEAALAWFSGLLTFLLDLTIFCTRALHAVPMGYGYWGRPSLFLIVGYYSLLAASMLRCHLGWTVNRIFLCWVGALTVWLLGVSGFRLLQARELRVDVLDVGHGDCLVVRTPSQHIFLVDTASEQAGRLYVVPFLRYSGISSLDALIVTHMDFDHVGGLMSLAEAVRIKRILTNGAKDDRMAARRLARLVAERGIARDILQKGMSLDGNLGVAIEVLHPPAGFSSDGSFSRSLKNPRDIQAAQKGADARRSSIRLSPSTIAQDSALSNVEGLRRRTGKYADEAAKYATQQMRLFQQPVSPNDASLVLQLTKGSVSILLTGDIDEKGLPFLVREAGKLRSTVLKIPHHGSRLGPVGEEFFSLVHPKLALLSVGRAHGLPSAETMHSLARRGILVFSTRQDGAIHLRTDGKNLSIQTTRSHRKLRVIAQQPPLQ